jgi:hypothetical protein
MLQLHASCGGVCDAVGLFEVAWLAVRTRGAAAEEPGWVRAGGVCARSGGCALVPTCGTDYQGQVVVLGMHGV